MYPLKKRLRNWDCLFTTGLTHLFESKSHKVSSEVVTQEEIKGPTTPPWTTVKLRKKKDSLKRRTDLSDSKRVLETGKS